MGAVHSKSTLFVLIASDVSKLKSRLSSEGYSVAYSAVEMMANDGSFLLKLQTNFKLFVYCVHAYNVYQYDFMQYVTAVCLISHAPHSYHTFRFKVVITLT